VSSVEEVQVLKKILGRLPKTEFSSYDRPLDRIIALLAQIAESGITSSPSFGDHVALEVDLDWNQKAIALPRRALVLKLTAIDAPVYVNLDREVTDTEYIPIPPYSYIVIPRATSVVYAKTLIGYTGKLQILGLSGAGS